MAVLAPDLVPSAEARRARSRHSEPPRCDELRFCALVMALTHYLETTRVSAFINLGLVIQAEFALTGFLLAGFLLKNRGDDEPLGWPDRHRRPGTILRIMPISFLFGIVVAAHYLPGILTQDSLSSPNYSEWPALFLKSLSSGLTDFIQGSGDGHFLIAWPLMILFVPRRLLRRNLPRNPRFGPGVSVLGTTLGRSPAGVAARRPLVTRPPGRRRPLRGDLARLGQGGQRRTRTMGPAHGPGGSYG